MKIIVNTSTFKQDRYDTSPNFINNLIKNMNKDSTFIFYILEKRRRSIIESWKEYLPFIHIVILF